MVNTPPQESILGSSHLGGSHLGDKPARSVLTPNTKSGWEVSDSKVVTVTTNKQTKNVKDKINDFRSVEKLQGAAVNSGKASFHFQGRGERLPGNIQRSPVQGRAAPIAIRRGREAGTLLLPPPAGQLRCRKSFLSDSRKTGRLTPNPTKDRNYEALWSNDFFRLEENDNSKPTGPTAPK